MQIIEEMQDCLPVSHVCVSNGGASAVIPTAPPGVQEGRNALFMGSLFTQFVMQFIHTNVKEKCGQNICCEEHLTFGAHSPQDSLFLQIGAACIGLPGTTND